MAEDKRQGWLAELKVGDRVGYGCYIYGRTVAYVGRILNITPTGRITVGHSMAGYVTTVALALMFCFATGTSLERLPLVVFFIPLSAVWAVGGASDLRGQALFVGLLLAAGTRLMLWVRG